jgi:DNA mismatch endonuclease, patch repair protein
MQGNRRRDTAPELAVRRLLHAAGCRYRVDVPPLTGLRRRADVVFTKQKLAVFIDGCYWHGCPSHGTTPATNTEYWSSKVAANRRRDQDTNDRLGAAGWCVARYWEHEPAETVAADIMRRLRNMRALPAAGD